jgi:5-methylcytosine-specific restriction enzyme A
MVSEKWSEHEFEVAVNTYFKILKMEQNGVAYKKSDIRKDVLKSSLNNRTESSYEFRMRNISAVMTVMGLKYIKGYRPAANVGNNANLLIKKLIEKEINSEEECLSNTADEDLLNKRVQILKDKLDLSLIPCPNNAPKSSKRASNDYERSPLIKAWVLQYANGKCEACEGISPFKTSEGYYLEVHHMKPLASNGTDSISNAVALCPNCHRRLHYSIDKVEYMEMIYLKVNRLRIE